MSGDPELRDEAAGPVTATVTRRVKQGHEAAYEEFLAGINGAAKAFPGYLGEEVFRPAARAGSTGSCTALIRARTCGRGWILVSARRGWRAPSRTSPGRCAPST